MWVVGQEVGEEVVRGRNVASSRAEKGSVDTDKILEYKVKVRELLLHR